jgi:diguanylate cyclase
VTDPLTGLLNRRGFDHQIERIAHGGMRGCTLLIVDIDHFKAINDAHGHLLGDKVIVAVANVLRACIGERGPIARIGGEEFAALLSHTSSAGGVELAERIRAAVELGKIRRADTDESIGNVTVSLGLATGGDSEQFEAMTARADRALYQSKTAGRNRVTVAERAPSAAA